AVEQAMSIAPEDAALIRTYFLRVAPEDQPRRAEDITSMVATHRQLAERRLPGETLVRTSNPPSGADGWGRASTVVDIVTDDMPYLVDSVISELTAAGSTVHRLLHPILAVSRSADGTLQEVMGEATSGLTRGAGVAESWMHLLIDRLTDPDGLADLESQVKQALDHTRRVVTDTPAMTDQARQVAAALRGASPAGQDGSDGRRDA